MTGGLPGIPLAALSSLGATLIAGVALAVACAVLSVLVVLRRWAFIGEGIAHAGFGGAGTAWMLALALPAGGLMSQAAGAYLVAVLFCIAVGLGIAWVTRRRHVYPDTAIGIFLVTSLAWGFIAKGAYQRVRGMDPPAWEDLLMGQVGVLGDGYVLAVALVCAAAVVVVALLWKEILSYCFDPELAEVSGVRAAAMHYLLLILLTLMIVIGIRVMGSLLMTALLVLPGATALLLSQRMKHVMAISVGTAALAAIAGPLIHQEWPFIPFASMIVVVMVAEFGLACALRGAVRRKMANADGAQAG